MFLFVFIAEHSDLIPPESVLKNSFPLLKSYGYHFTDVSPFRFIINCSGILDLESKIFWWQSCWHCLGHYQVQFVHVSYKTSLTCWTRADRTWSSIAALHLCFTSPNCNGTIFILCPHNFLAMFVSCFPKVECKTSHFRITYT